jgi:alginate O-acetyltransferase complex protein AlgI
MVFTSPTFLFFFLPLTLLLNYLFQKYKSRNGILLLMSLLFYIFGEGELVLLMIGSITINYFLGLWIDKKKSKKALFIGVTINLLILFINKYTTFLIENINSILDAVEIAPVEDVYIRLPVGISFYTFQSISYLVDVYRKDNKAQKSFIDLALYVALFPQLIAGPIVRYKDIAQQLKTRVQNLAKFKEGIERFIIGLGKKVIISNSLAVVADYIFETDISKVDASSAWLGIIFYSLQIYFDFSGYSDMAIGLGKMLGFDFLENFNFPYISKSIREFWQRWHISLSNWFRDYLYISLGGNRVSNKRTYINLFIVFFLTGLWHGASWNFVIWGLIHGVFIVVERLGFDKFLDRAKIIRNLYTLFVVVIAWVFFRLETFADASSYIATMFSGTSSEVHYHFSMFLSMETTLIFIIAIIMSFNGFNLTVCYLKNKFQLINNSTSVKTFELLKYFGLLSIFIYSIMSVASGSYNPFIYFRF